jgi:CRP-like cAMP-binding protein
MTAPVVEAAMPQAPIRNRRSRASGPRSAHAATGSQGANRSSGGREVAATDPAVARALAALLGTSLADGSGRAVEAFARVRPLDAGRSVFARNERARSLVLLAQGDVALGLERAEQGFEVERIAHGPAWLDLASAWLGAPHAIDARAHSACVVVELPLDPLRERLEQQPALSLRLIHGLAQELQARASQTSGLMHLSAPARLAHWLRSHARNSAAQPGRSVVELSERKRDLAAQLAIAPETLSRLLRRLVSDGVIDVSGYTVHVRNRAALDELARL